MHVHVASGYHGEWFACTSFTLDLNPRSRDWEPNATSVYYISMTLHSLLFSCRVDTACNSSLQAMASARRDILNSDCDYAIATGALLNFRPGIHEGAGFGPIVRAFDAKGLGYWQMVRIPHQDLKIPSGISQLTLHRTKLQTIVFFPEVKQLGISTIFAWKTFILFCVN